MSRLPNYIRPQDLSDLKEDIITKCGFKLNKSVDCDKLASCVNRETRENINGITFKRIFGFTKYPYNPSYQTLDLLCRYLGYRDWATFLSVKNSESAVSLKEIELYLSFYQIDQINKVENYEGGLQSISRQIIKRIISDPSIFKIAINTLVPNKYAQIYIFEHFPVYDYLIPFYHYAYEKYIHHKKTKEALLFGNSLLFLNEFWQLKKEKAYETIKTINEVGISHQIHPFVIGRYFACNLYYRHFFDNNKSADVASKILAYEQNIQIGTSHFQDFPAFHYIVSEALLHCGYYKEAIKIIDVAFHRYSISREFVRKGYYQQLQMFRAEACFEIGEKDTAKKLIKKINPSNFYFISQKYYTALFYIIKHKISPDDSDMKKAAKLIQDMQNKFLNRRFYEVFNASCL